MPEPILYSFRRCPYAMRARMAIRLCGVTYEHREILLRDKPQAMLDVSPKGTVPVLVTEDKQVIDESLDVMLWAIENSNHALKETVGASRPWVSKNDTFFKPNLDRYKYPNRYEDEGDADKIRQKAYAQAKIFLQELEEAVHQNGGFILSDKMALADVAIFPFIRQFAKVDEKMWAENPYKNLKQWLNLFMELSDFKYIMKKHDLWTPQSTPLIIASQTE